MSFNRSLLTQITKDLADKKKPAIPKAGAQQKIGDSNPYYIDKSDIAGKGAFAKQFIPKGSPINMLHQINQPGVDYDFTQLGRTYNHSEDPNTINRLVGNQRFMVANQDIFPGQELTGDYRMQPDLEQPQEDWKMKNGGQMIKRKDGSYSKRGLWDNIRANKGSGKKPTKQMLEQERKIRANEKAYGGDVYANGGTHNPGFAALPDYVQHKILSEMAYGGYMPEYGNGGYTVTRSSDRKGKTHKVTGPDGTVKYFGDSKLGQHPSDPDRKAAFYARHKKNLDGNPFFRAFARATWQTGGQTINVQADRNFVKTWNDSPMAQQMLANSVDRDDPYGFNSAHTEAMSDVRNTLTDKAKVNIVKPSYIINRYKKIDPDRNASGIAGYASPGNATETVESQVGALQNPSNYLNNMDSDYAKYKHALSYNTEPGQIVAHNNWDRHDVNQTLVHELSHAPDYGGHYIPNSDINKMRAYSKRRAKDEFTRYVAEPTETRARLMNFRYNAKNQGIYDPFTQKINVEQLQKYNSGNHPGYDPLNQLREVYSDKQIIDLLNTVSYNEKGPNPEQAQARYGGESDNVKKFMDVYQMKYGGGTPAFKQGGQTRDEREMVNGIADILSKVKDRGNRGEIAQEMIQDFEDEGVTYNVKKFMDLVNLKYGGTPYTHLQDGGEAQPEPEYTGSSVVDYLATKGFEGSKTFRKELAKDMGVEGYDFSAKKNLELLSALRKAEALPIGYEESFDPVSPQKMMALEKKRGVYVPMPQQDQVEEQPQVVSQPQVVPQPAPRTAVPVAAVPVDSTNRFYTPRVPVTQPKKAVPAPAKKPAAQGAPNAFRIPMAAPANPYAGFFDPRIPQNTVPASKAPVAAPVARGKINPFAAVQQPGSFPGGFNQQQVLAAIQNRPAAQRTIAPVKNKVAFPVGKYEAIAPIKPQIDEKDWVFEDDTSFNPWGLGPVSQGPIAGSNVNRSAYEAVADDISNLWEKATNWWDRKSAMSDGKQERKSNIDPKKIAADPIYMTGDTIPDKNGRYHTPEVMDLNYLRFGTRNRGDYRPIDTEAGSITAFKPFEPAKDYFAKNNDPANSTYLGVGTDGKIKVGSRADFQNGDYKISKTFSNKVVDFNRNPDGSIVKVKSNPKASKETFSPSVKVMGDDGKVIDGKLSLLLPKSGNQEESFDLVTGGRYIMQTPDGKFEMVSGSLKNIEARFNKLKKGNPYVNVITLDNGSYSRGIRTYNKKLTAKDLKKYDNQNTEGGNFAYLMPDNPSTRYDAKFNDFQSAAQNRLQSLYPGKKVEVKFQNEGVYDARGSRAIESQADILKKGYSQAPISMHNFDAARDYVLYVDGKPIDANKQKKVYKDVLWKAADQTGMYHLDDWDVVHIGLAKEGEKTAFNELYSKFPDIFASGNFKKSVAFIEKNKNNPAYKEAYELLHNIKPYVPKTQAKAVAKKQYGGSWLDKYN